MSRLRGEMDYLALSMALSPIANALFCITAVFLTAGLICEEKGDQQKAIKYFTLCIAIYLCLKSFIGFCEGSYYSQDKAEISHVLLKHNKN